MRTFYVVQICLKSPNYLIGFNLNCIQPMQNNYTKKSNRSCKLFVILDLYNQFIVKIKSFIFYINLLALKIAPKNILEFTKHFYSRLKPFFRDTLYMFTLNKDNKYIHENDVN